MRVLVVDDDEASRYLAAALLKAHGHDVVEARDGREALDKARGGGIDIVVSDILMPVMDGYTFLREWKADASLSAAPVIFYTASYTEPEDRRFAERLGADVFMVKPQEPEVFVATVEDTFTRSGGETIGSKPPELRRESDVLRDYSARIVAKLEQKVVELDGANRDLTRTVGVLSDEVEVKEALIEQLTADADETRRVEEMKSGFVSMVSHELRTPLTSVIGYTDLLEQMDTPENIGLFHQFLGKIHDSADRMRSLVDNLLDVSRIQTGPVRPELESVDAAEFVKAEVGWTQVPAGRSVHFTGQSGGCRIFVDRSRLGRAIRHLIGNALKYSPDGGDVEVSVSYDEEYLRIAVADEGIGIAPGELAHVFDRFVQADMSDTRSFGGIGVGLYLARQTVEAHRGLIEVVSTEGEGSVFTIVLPVIA